MADQSAETCSRALMICAFIKKVRQNTKPTSNAWIYRASPTTYVDVKLFRYQCLQRSLRVLALPLTMKNKVQLRQLDAKVLLFSKTACIGPSKSLIIAFKFLSLDHFISGKGDERSETGLNDAPTRPDQGRVHAGSCLARCWHGGRLISTRLGSSLGLF